MKDEVFTCHDYVGVTCVNGNCPNAIDDLIPDHNPQRISCRECLSNYGCQDCGYPDIIETTREECRKRHDWKAKKPTMTNGDKIRLMSDEELADFLDELTSRCQEVQCERCIIGCERNANGMPLCDSFNIMQWVKGRAGT